MCRSAQLAESCNRPNVENLAITCCYAAWLGTIAAEGAKNVPSVNNRSTWNNRFTDSEPT
jgi:hypothetical protein